MFGIQSRGGCSCAGPYGHRLLGIEPDRARQFAACAVDGWLGIKPGWTRLSFSFYGSEPEFQYVVEAVHLIARSGARLLPDYRFDLRSGLWTHRDASVPHENLAELAFDRGLGGGLRPADRRRRVPEGELVGYLSRAAAILAGRPEVDDRPGGLVEDRLDRLRWFPLPDVCLSAIG